ncbi:MAG: aminotransferase, partial [Rhodocyclaceae bacterium]
MIQSASRLADIEPFHVMELLTRAKQLEAEGRDIIHMEVGEPDFPTPAPIVEAAQRAIAGGRMFYT